MKAKQLIGRINALNENDKLEFQFGENVRGTIQRFIDLGERIPITSQCSAEFKRPGFEMERWNIDSVDSEFLHLYTINMDTMKRYAMKMPVKNIKTISA